MAPSRPRRSSRLDRPLWRADLFDRLRTRPGASAPAHYHPWFNGNEPCDRNWDPALTADPWHGWATSSPAWARRRAGSVADRPRGCPGAARPGGSGRRPGAGSSRRERCGSAAECFRLTQDVRESVQLMIDQPGAAGPARRGLGVALDSAARRRRSDPARPTGSVGHCPATSITRLAKWNQVPYRFYPEYGSVSSGCRIRLAGAKPCSPRLASPHGEPHAASTSTQFRNRDRPHAGQLPGHPAGLAPGGRHTWKSSTHGCSITSCRSPVTRAGRSSRAGPCCRPSPPRLSGCAWACW